MILLSVAIKRPIPGAHNAAIPNERANTPEAFAPQGIIRRRESNKPPGLLENRRLLFIRSDY
jgi:hypothetical protein